MSFADKVKKLVESAPVASVGANVNFGPTTFTPMIVVWKGRGNQPDKYTLQEYAEKNGLKSVDEIELEAGKESFQLHVDIDVTELNPTLDFHVERDIEIKESNKSSKDPDKHILTSWSEIVQPSIEKVFGKDWYAKILPNGKKAAPVLYTASETVDPVEPAKEGKKVYKVPKFIAVYASLEECRKARDERYPPRDDAEAMEFPPDEEGEDGDDEGGFPADVLEQTVTLYNSTRQNKKQTLKMLGSHPFGEYDPEELLKAALEQEEE